ncbi:MAG: hypothetical protein HOK29_12930 [Candidatus Marinimicrobia bacterium]|jgi:hypothetical protein|nr:hypothetical protein [Candidatus Neomarinimicrobiota bacterium]
MEILFMNQFSYKSFNSYRLILSLSLLLIISLFLYANTQDQLGDVNNDGSIDVQDIVLVVDIILNDEVEYGEYELWASDVNLDGFTDVIDIVLIIPVILAFDECEEQYSPCIDNFSLCCPDSTGHEFNWEVDTFGNYGSRLYDVAIVGENNFWVVGDIITDDGEYNAAHWDGENWELMGIYSNTLDLFGINYFSENDIWVTSHCFPYHWEGETWTQYHLNNMGLDVCVGLEMWGTSSSNMYFVGINGAIVHYDGENFTQMESGTDVDLMAITGTDDGEYVFSVGWDDTYPGRSVILEFNNGQWDTFYYCEGVLPSESCQGAVNTVVDVIDDTAYFILGFVGLWKYNYLTGESEIIPENDIHFTNRGFQGLKGQEENDVSFITNGSELIHYNGSTWHLDTTVLDQFGPNNIQTLGMDFNEDIVISVGYVWEPARAFVARGLRD